MTDWQELEHKYLMNTFKRLPVTLVRGSGVRVWDDKGREYLDFIGGLAVDVLGHAHPELARAISEQAHTLIQTSNLVYTIPQIRLAQLLVENSCFDRVFLCNSGTEATEGAVKLSRRYGKLRLGGAYEVITTMDSFHGRTLAMTAATGQKKFQEPYTPLPIGFVNVDYDSIDAIKRATGPDTCAVMLEAIQGEGGVNMPGEDYLKKVRAWCDEKGIVFILDEIQTGMGRTGTLFAYQQFGVEPDIMALAKGLGGGVPIGAFLAKERVSVFAPGEHGTTFGGNPLACAAGYTTLKYVLEQDLVGNCRRVGSYLMSGLNRLRSQFDFINEVRGRGLLVAMEFSSDIAEMVVMGCLEGGLLLNPVKPSTIRFIPPLITTQGDVNQALAILTGVLTRVGAEMQAPRS